MHVCHSCSYSFGIDTFWDSQRPDFWQNDTQLYFVRFSVFVESKETFQRSKLCLVIMSISRVGMIILVNLVADF